MKAYMYILHCSNNTYYTGSTRDLKRRVAQHEEGTGSNYTSKHLPVKLVYFEVFWRIDHAFEREKQVQNWSQKKKEALINGKLDELKKFSRKNEVKLSSKGKRHKRVTLRSKICPS